MGLFHASQLVFQVRKLPSFKASSGAVSSKLSGCPHFRGPFAGTAGATYCSGYASVHQRSPPPGQGLSTASWPCYLNVCGP